MIFRRFGVFIFTAAVCACIIIPVDNSLCAGSDADKIVKRVKKTLDSIKTMSCSFDSEQVWKNLDRKRHITGAIYMKIRKPFMFRMERPGQITIIDGKTIWTYLPKHRQVQISDYDDKGRDFPSPHTVFSRFIREREAVLSGEEEINGGLCDIINLLSSDPEDVRVTVWIDRELHFPVKAVEETSGGDVITHILSDVRLNEKMRNDLFTFILPEGVTEVDMRE